MNILTGRLGSISAPLPLREIDLSRDADEARSLVQEATTPFVARRAADSWPALSRWSDRYLSQMAGHLQVTAYPAQDYRGGTSQREVEECRSVSLAELLRQLASESATECSYVRETRVLSQVAQLRADIRKPLLLTESKPHTAPRTGNSEASAWIGPAQTRAQLHWDPEHNLFVQIRGRKMFTLASPSAARDAYPIEFTVDECATRSFFQQRPTLLNKLQTAAKSSSDVRSDEKSAPLNCDLMKVLSNEDYSNLCNFLLDVNNFHVDAEAPNLRRHPLFANVQRAQSTLNPGDLIFIPRFWLHAVRSLEVSISVNWFFLQSTYGSGVEEAWIHELLLSHLTK